MSSQSRVLWKEGLFLRPHHFQQNDRYHERLLEARVRNVTPYPWGFSAVEIDRDLLEQRKFALRRAAGILPDGTPFDAPADSPLPPPVDIPEAASGQFVWLTMPTISPNTREVDEADSDSASRYVAGTEMFIDSSSSLRIEEEIDLALPRLALELRKTAKPGFTCLGIARILEVRDKAVLLDGQYVPPALLTGAHPTIEGWIDRVLGWINNKVDELARYAADPTARGGMQSTDYFMLQILNRESPALRHFRRSRYVHPERLYEALIRLAGELATLGSPERRAHDYVAYDHDDLHNSFEPVLRDIQAFLSVVAPTRPIRLEIVERAQNAFVSAIRDRSLFRTANLILEVSARRPLTEIQVQFPHLFKIGPNTKMNEIVHAHLPGVGLQHLPTPPPQIRALADHVYFLLDRTSPLWPDFSTAQAIAMHFSGDWPELELELWAIPGDRR